MTKRYLGLPSSVYSMASEVAAAQGRTAERFIEGVVRDAVECRCPRGPVVYEKVDGDWYAVDCEPHAKAESCLPSTLPTGPAELQGDAMEADLVESYQPDRFVRASQLPQKDSRKRWAPRLLSRRIA